MWNNGRGWGDLEARQAGLFDFQLVEAGLADMNPVSGGTLQWRRWVWFTSNFPFNFSVGLKSFKRKFREG